jgi:hypothetical protein
LIIPHLPSAGHAVFVFSFAKIICSVILGVRTCLSSVFAPLFGISFLDILRTWLLYNSSKGAMDS